MVINGYACLLMVIHGYQWLWIKHIMDDYRVLMVINGYVWLSMIINGYGVSSMVINDCGWLLMVMCGY